MGWKQWTRERLSSTELQSYLQDQAVLRFASASARSAQLAAPAEGMVSTLDDTNEVARWDPTRVTGGAWVPIANPKPTRQTLNSAWEHWPVLNPTGDTTLNYEPLHLTGIGTEASLRGLIALKAGQSVAAGGQSAIVDAGGIPALWRPVGYRALRWVIIAGTTVSRAEVRPDGSVWLGPTPIAVGTNFLEFDFSWSINNNV